MAHAPPPSKAGNNRGNAHFLFKLDWEFDLTLPFATALIIVLGWYLFFHYESSLTAGVTAAFETTQLEVARTAARGYGNQVTDLVRRGRDVAEAEREAAAVHLEPISPLGLGRAWLEFPESPESSGDGRFRSELEAKGEKTGLIARSKENGPEVVSCAPTGLEGRRTAVCVATPLARILNATGAESLSRYGKGLMLLITLGGLGLVITSARNIMKRQRAESALARANADLEERVARGAEALAQKNRALMEMRLREKIKEKEAEIAYAQGLVESAGQYLHHIGNSLTALEVQVLRIRKALSASGRYANALAAIREAHLRATRGEQGPDRTLEYLDLFEETLLGRVAPQAEESVAAILDLKDRMIDSMEQQRRAYGWRGGPERFLQEIDLNELMADIAVEQEERCRELGVDLTTDFEAGLAVTNRRHPLAHGLRLLASALVEEAGRTKGTVALSVRRDPDDPRRASLVLQRRDGDGRGDAAEPRAEREAGFTMGLHAFINFLNENHGRFQEISLERPAGKRYLVEIDQIGDRLDCGGETSGTDSEGVAFLDKD